MAAAASLRQQVIHEISGFVRNYIALGSVVKPWRARHVSPGFSLSWRRFLVNGKVAREPDGGGHCLNWRKSLALQELGIFLAIVISANFC